MKIKYLPIIINPAAGKPEPILSILNEVFKDSGIKWDVLIAKRLGDAAKFVKDSIEKEVDTIAVYGGDGTVMEVISGIVGKPIQLVIFPGGTANVLATDLGIPMGLKEVSLLIKEGNYQFHSVDVGQFNRKYFILRACLGFEAEMVKGADRKTKNKWGRFAYLFAALEAVKKVKLIQYDVTIDGVKQSVKGLTCIIANSGSAGFADLSLAKQIDVSDGLLDVLVIKKFDLSLIKYMMRVLLRGNPAQDRELVGHWQGKEIKVSSRPQQDVVCDGEVLGRMAIHAKIIPEAVQILVPKSKATSS
jgi:diacylglycerol kinase (ATP)